VRADAAVALPAHVAVEAECLVTRRPSSLLQVTPDGVAARADLLAVLGTITIDVIKGQE
jgi:hypothetical protein